jgi:hypothetical protein
MPPAYIPQDIAEIIEKAAKEPGINDALALLRLSQESNEIEQISSSRTAPPLARERPDYPSETFRALREKEIRQFGEYRTQRPVLEACCQMKANGDFKAMGM